MLILCYYAQIPPNLPFMLVFMPALSAKGYRRLTQVNRILLLAVCDVYVSSLTWTVWATHYVRICENQDLQIAQLDCMHNQAIWPAWQISQRNLQIARNTMVTGDKGCY